MVQDHMPDTVLRALNKVNVTLDCTGTCFYVTLIID